MIKKLIYIFTFSIALAITIASTFSSHALDRDDYDIVYFGSYYCSSCQGVENDGVFDTLEAQGYRVKKYMLEDDRDATERWHINYLFTYGVPETGVDKIPIIFVGDTYFAGRIQITTAVNNGAIQAIADDMQLLEILEAPEPPMQLNFREIIRNLGVTLFMGLGDAFNICAIAMLLLFISFLSQTKNTKAIAYICLAYITAIFISYFIIGAVLAEVFLWLAPYFFIFAWIIIALASFLFIFNMYDFIMAKRRQYGAIKNQLPKGVFKFTKRMMDGFSAKIEFGSKTIYVTAFFIGVVVALIEFPCTGQVYVSWLAYMTSNMSSDLLFYLYLGFYNLLFISPLIVISILAIRSQSIVAISNFMRERMDMIKLFNALIFLFVIIYYLWLVL